MIENIKIILDKIWNAREADNMKMQNLLNKKVAFS